MSSLRSELLALLQIWTQREAFRGWIIAAKQLVPDSFPALLQLPAEHLRQALQQLHKDTIAELSRFVKDPACAVTVPRDSIMLLNELEEGQQLSNNTAPVDAT